MIEVSDTLIADRAVFGLGTDGNFADVAKLVLDYVLVFFSVESRCPTATLFSALQQHRVVGRVTANADHMRHNVAYEKAGIADSSDPHQLWRR